MCLNKLGIKNGFVKKCIIIEKGVPQILVARWQFLKICS